MMTGKAHRPRPEMMADLSMGNSGNTTGGAMQAQLPLGLHHEPSTAREDLVVSDPLSAAIRIIDEWPQWPARVVILAGPSGSGKSHLAEIWKKRSSARQIGAGHDDRDAIAAAMAAPVLIEDIDRTGFDETVLFHLINAVQQGGGWMLITTRIWPAAWPVDLPDLRSRLKAATVVEIGEPDDVLLSQVIVKLFADRQITVDEKTVSYLVTHMERSLDAARRVVHRMDTLALSRGRKIGRQIAAEVLREMELEYRAASGA